MTLAERQAARLDAILPWAERVGELRDVWCPGTQHVHLRPSGTGIRIIDLHPSRPQLDRGKLACLATAREDFLRLVTQSRRDAPGRSTPEKSLQSWLMREAYAADRRLAHLARDITLVTDEQRFPTQGKDVVCDFLAVRTSKHGTAPVVIELKPARLMSRLVEQVQAMAAVVDAHRERFGRLFSAFLGRPVVLDLPSERWIVWPAAAGHSTDPQASHLNGLGISLASYTEAGNSFTFDIAPVGRGR
jgi:hypothetical protein